MIKIFIKFNYSPKNFNTMNESTKQLFIKVLNKTTGKNYSNIDENIDLKNQINLDSIQIVELFAALEEEIGIELPLEMMNSKNISEFVSIIEKAIESKVNT